MPPMTLSIFNHLKAVGSITQVEAQALYRCRSLSRRITDIKQAGYSVRREMRKDHTGQRYARYFMRKGAR